MSFDLPLTALFRSNFFPPSILYSNFARQLYIDVKILEEPFFLLFSIHLYRIENSRISFNVLKKNIISLRSLRRSPTNPLKSQNQSHGNVKIESDPFTSFNIYISPEYIPYIPAHARAKGSKKISIVLHWTRSVCTSSVRIYTRIGLKRNSPLSA